MGGTVRRLIALVFAVAGLVGLVPAVAHAATYQESFEQGFGGWEPRSDGLTPEWKVTRSTDRPRHGLWGLRYDVNGSRDDGTVWVQRRLPVPPGARTVELRFWMWSDREAIAGNWAVMAYAGARDPRAEVDFTILGETNKWRGWWQFIHRVSVPANSSNQVTVALGVSVRWEVNRTDYFDLTTVSIV
jgi:hypothetical protein